MSWVRLDDRFYSHRKVMSVSLAARWLYVAALCVANQHSNNGILDQAAQDCLLVAVGRGGSFDVLAEELVKAGLWERHGVTDYAIHDYLEYQPSDEEQRKERAAAAERQRRFRERRHGGHAHDNASRNGVTNGVVNAAPSLPVPSRPYPSRPGINTLSNESDRAPAAQAPVSPSPGLPGIDPGVPEKPSKPPKAKRAGGVTQEVAALAETLLEELSAAIQRVRPGARVLRPIPGNVEHIAARLADGATAEEVRHVIAVCEAESRHNEKALQYFNAVSPFRRDNFARNLARTLEDAAKPDRARGAWRDPTVGSNTGQHTPEQEWDAWRRT